MEKENSFDKNVTDRPKDSLDWNDRVHITDNFSFKLLKTTKEPDLDNEHYYIYYVRDEGKHRELTKEDFLKKIKKEIRNKVDIQYGHFIYKNKIAKRITVISNPRGYLVKATSS